MLLRSPKSPQLHNSWSKSRSINLTSPSLLTSLLTTSSSSLTHSVHTKMRPLSKPLTIINFTLLLSLLPTLTLSQCRDSCGDISINYPFGLDDGCGAPQFRRMLNCSTDLFFLTPSGSYKVESINYDKKTIVVYDPAMSTCSILQPHHDFLITDIQSALIPPTSDTVFALLNCSIDSPVLNHYSYLCFNFSSHSCDELYGSCNAFRVFHMMANTTSPPCCFTSYDTVKFMSMNVLDCTHYTTVTNTDGLSGIGPQDWVYGIKMSFAVPDSGCDRCAASGGTCGFDTETEGQLCLCSSSSNYTRECGLGSVTAGVNCATSSVGFQAFFVIVLIYKLFNSVALFF